MSHRDALLLFGGLFAFIGLAGCGAGSNQLSPATALTSGLPTGDPREPAAISRFRDTVDAYNGNIVSPNAAIDSAVSSRDVQGVQNAAFDLKQAAGRFDTSLTSIDFPTAALPAVHALLTADALLESLLGRLAGGSDPLGSGDYAQLGTDRQTQLDAINAILSALHAAFSYGPTPTLTQ